jgi:DNA-binding PadR family transcriptional regulator
MPKQNQPDVDELLQTWEEVYKKGLLSFWILLFLHERPAYAYEAAAAVAELSQGTLTADENSLYRALNRFEGLGIVTSEKQPSAVGPARRYYRLTEAGEELLRRFARRNLLVFASPAVAPRLAALLNGHRAREVE